MVLKSVSQLWGTVVGFVLVLFAATLALTVYCDGLMVTRTGHGFLLGSGAVEIPANPALGAVFYAVSRGLIVMGAVAAALSILVAIATDDGLAAVARSLWAPVRTPAGTIVDIGKWLVALAFGYLVLKIGSRALGRS